MISIIIRTKNEQRWISLCLTEVFRQENQDFEVILIDNHSTDRTLELAKQFNVAVLEINDYRPGKAINLGVQHSNGEIIVCLSGHCIPTNNKWLDHLIRDLKDPQIAGIYGRQEPLAYSSDSDKRDLLTIFGLDKKNQIKDSFFHNANSAMRKEILLKFPFDEEVPNIEDRVWGSQVIDNGYRIVYEPAASVYHYHGINQDNDPERCRNVVRILEHLENGKNNLHKSPALGFDPADLEIMAIIPIKGPGESCGGKPLIEYTLQRALESKYIKKIVVSTDDREIASIAAGLGAEVPFLRPPDLSREFVDINTVLQYTLQNYHQHSYFPDLVMMLEITYPFRPAGFIDKMILKFIREGTSCLVPVLAEPRSLWIKDENNIQMFGRFMPRTLKDEHVYISLLGLGFITLAKNIKEGRMMGEKIGIYEVQERYCALEIRDQVSIRFADHFIHDYWLNAYPPVDKNVAS
jgi:glycosyltransferase involved in cell wall biosynthesis/CMP-N-acetylneuraminic acid synthetase